MILTKRRAAYPLALSCAFAAALLSPPAAHAQKPTPSAKPSAAAPAAAVGASTAQAAPEKQVVLSPTRPGVYSFWTVGKNGQQSAIGNLAAGQKTAPVSLPTGTTEINVLDEATGTLAVYSAAKLAAGATVPIAPADFTFVKSVQVAVTANGGKPVEKASVSLTGANGKTVSRVLTAADNGVARFDNVPVGKASVTASYGDMASGGPKVTQETTIAPPKGGGAVELPITLSGGNVPTLAASPTAVQGGTGTNSGAGNTPAGPNGFPAVDNRDANAPGNNWIPGVVGMLLMAGGIVYGIRYAMNKGVTIPSALKQLGVEMPQDAPATNAGLKPAAPVLPPLPSLGDLPAAGAAPGAVAAPLGGVMASAGGSAVAGAVLANPRLVGLVGPVGGETFPLDSGPLTVGRDEGNTLALTQDTTLSRKHARIENSGGNNWAVSDAGSSNGTFVNGQKVVGSQTLRVGDEIQIGASRFRFEA